MGFGDLDLMDDGGGKASSTVSCSICLEIVTDGGDRSWAKLQCGHHFHLDCIGSAFNVKGAMQCPNCRKIEKGQWLYSNGSRPYAEFNMEDYFHDEDIYDLSYAEMSFGVHWCPFSGLTRLPSSFDEGELSSTAYHDLLGQHAVFAEQTAVSSASHPCPYVAYFGPFPSSSSNTSGSVGDGSNVSNHWNSQSAPSEIRTSYAFPPMDVHYHSWEQHSSLFPTASSHITGHDQPSLPSMTQRASRNNFDISRSGSFVHPFTAGHGSNARAASSVPDLMLPPYLGSAARARERAQALQAYFQHPPGNSQGVRTPVMAATRRSNNSHRNLTQGGPVASSSEQASGFYFFPPSSSAGRNNSEVENPMSNRFHAWEREQQFPSYPVNQAERDPIWGPIHQLPSASDTSGLRPTSFRHRHGL